MKKHAYILLLLFGSLQAQHDNIWYFGDKAGLDFSSGAPVALQDSQMTAHEGCATISDENGQLLFYSNGVNVWDRSHQVMQNGTGLLGNASSTQMLILPKMGQAGIFYIFTLDSEGKPNGFRYSEVDINAAGGMGAVTLKNVLIQTPACEKITATRHANGVDVWVLVHQYNSNAFYAYPITANGIGLPVISNTGSAVTAPTTAPGSMKLSHDGTRLAVANHHMNAQLFDFNNTTGTVSNPVTLFNVNNTAVYGIEFSPSGSLLYITTVVTGDGRIFQYDLTAANVASSAVAVYSSNYFISALQLAPDGRIYASASGKMAVIANPDVAGPACNVLFDFINMGTGIPESGLPYFMDSSFLSAGIYAENLCLGDQTLFSIRPATVPDSVLWDFGDGFTSQENSPSHRYADALPYTVTLTYTRQGLTKTVQKTITISPLPYAIQPQDMLLCDGGNGQETFSLRSNDSHILSFQPAPAFAVTYYASLPNADMKVNPLPDDYHIIRNPQLVYARVDDIATGCYAVTSFSLAVLPAPEIEMKDEYSLCGQGSITIAAPPGFNHYLWEPGGQVTQAVTVTEPGNIVLTVFKDHGNVTCTAQKTIRIFESAMPKIKDVVISEWTDHDNSIAILPENPGNYQYSVDGITYQDTPEFYDLDSGVYTVFLKDREGCGIARKEIALLNYPKYFTPNGDGTNETWRIEFAQFVPEFNVTIYDRYGKLITTVLHNGSGWDGTYNGQNLPSSDYWFVALRPDGEKIRGHFAMIR